LISIFDVIDEMRECESLSCHHGFDLQQLRLSRGYRQTQECKSTELLKTRIRMPGYRVK
jgi:hypothetical protein